MYKHVFITLCSLTFCLSDESDGSLFPVLPIAPLKSENEMCKTESVMYMKNLNNLTLWANKMWDATAKSTTGSLQGNSFQMGDWDECMKAQAPFNTQYCLAIIKANISVLEPHEDPFTLERDPLGSVLKRILNTHDISQASRDTVNIGWCTPASCSPQDLENALNDHLNQFETMLTKENATYKGVVLEKMCQRQGEEKTFELIDVIFCIILTFFIFVVIIATVYEFKLENELTEKEKQNYQRHIGRRILMGFSARKNFLDLARPDESNPSLSCLYGLRTVAIFMIILDHRFGTFTSGPLLNFDYVEEQYRSVTGWFIFHGDLFVDTFFIISGLLVTYGLMVQYQKKYIHPCFIIFLRYMRLTPLYAFVVLYYVTILNYIGSGPLWKLIVYQESKDCRDNWWTNLIYVNNYVNDDHISIYLETYVFADDMVLFANSQWNVEKNLIILAVVLAMQNLFLNIEKTKTTLIGNKRKTVKCITQTWYLSCDYHYFIITNFLIMILHKSKKMGFTLFIICFVLSIAVPFVITVIYLRPALLLFYPDFLVNPKAHQDFSLTYIKSHTRASPYCIGMIGGYIYYKLRDTEKQLSKLKSHFITLFSILLLLAGMAGGAVFYDPYHEYNALEAGAYAGLHKLSWSIGTLGLLFTASHGHTTVIQKVLSWSPFVPLGKLVYGAYLMHMSFQFRALALTPGSQIFDYFNLITWAIGDIVISFISGLILYILIETPMRKLCKELFMPSSKAVSPPEPVTRQNRINSSGGENDSRL